MLTGKGGKMKGNFCMAVFFLGVMLLFPDTGASAEPPHHPAIDPIPKSILENSSTHDNYTYEFPFYDEKSDTINYRRVTGTLRKQTYRIFGKDPQRKDGIFSSVEIIRTYRNLAVDNGGTVLWEEAEGGRLTFEIPKSEGGKTWCHVTARDGWYTLDIVETEPEKKSLGGFKISPLMFHPGSDDLSKEVMEQLRKLREYLCSHPGLKVEIQGYADDRGNKNENMSLSRKRAESVKRYLAGLGISPSRLHVKCYGVSGPVASNTGKDEGAKNRKVILVAKSYP